MQITFSCPRCQNQVDADTQLGGSAATCPHCNRAVTVPRNATVGPGTTVGGFRIEKSIGLGGMGEVFLATQLSMERRIALKVLTTAQTADASFIERFLHEARMVARLNHPNIVTAYEAGEDAGTYFLAMEFVEGETLEARLKTHGLFPEAEALKFMRKVAKALAYAWDEHHILHRDIKPANLMLDRHGEIKIMDMGLAKNVGSDDSGLTMTGFVIGTPYYMSPEQARAAADIDFRADLYSLGGTFYHLVTGSAPFGGTSVVDILSKHLNAPLPPARTRNPQLSEGCELLLEKMMAKDREQRYPTWRALVDDIDRVLHHQRPALAPAGGKASRPPISRPAAARPASRHNLPLLVGGTAIGAVVLIVCLVAVFRPRPAPRAAGAATATVAKTAPVATGAPAVPGRGALKPVPITPVVGGGSAGTQLPGPPSRIRPAAQAGTLAFTQVLPVPGQDWTVPEVRLELVCVAPGSFQMGANDGPANEAPAHPVRLSRGYWIGKYEVTQAEYEAVTGSNPSRSKGAQNPVENVSWAEATAFCAKLTENERAAGRLPPGYDYRLPTEAEWEYAARGGTKRMGYGYSGSNSLGEVAWYKDNSGDKAHPVGQKKENELGLYDMSGNVWEYCSDWFGDYPSGSVTDPTGPGTGSDRVCRSGSYANFAALARIGTRNHAPATTAMVWNGFRLVLSGPATENPASGGTAPAAAQPPAAESAAPVLAKLYRDVVDDLLRNDVPAAARHAAEAKADRALSTAGKELSDLALQLSRLGVMPEVVMAGFAGDKSKDVKVELRSGMDSVRIDSVTGRNVSAQRIIRTGSGSMQAASNFAYSDLSYREKAKRLALAATGPDAALLQGMLALENRQPAPARKLFADSATELGKLLAARLAEPEPTPVIEPEAAPVLDPVPEEKKEVTDKRAATKSGKKEKADPKARLKPATVAAIEGAMAELKQANPDEPDLKYRYKITPEGIELELTKDGKTTGNQGMSDISAVAGLPLSVLVALDSAVTDLSPLAGMPLTVLYISRTPVESLEPLKGLKLKQLFLKDTKVTDLSPLQGMPLEVLEVPGSFSDEQIPFIAGCPITALQLSKSQVSDLSGLRKFKLASFAAWKCPNLRDLTPLKGMPLTRISIQGTPVESMACLKTLERLTRIEISCDQLEILSLAKPLPRLDTLQVMYGCTTEPDLQLLKAFPHISNLTLNSANATWDITPLGDLRELKQLDLQAVSVKDVSPLAECKKLEVLMLPKGVENVDKLHKLPNLKTINGMPAAKFLKKFAAENVER